jgi:hypothetical protein
LRPVAFHLLLCGLDAAWRPDEVRRLRERYGKLVAVHKLAREAAPGVLHDHNGSALTRLGAKQPAQYLVRPDGHIGFRSGGADLRGATGYGLRCGSRTSKKPVQAGRGRNTTTKGGGGKC